MKHKGFTLVELLIVITLIGILATITSGNFFKSIKRAKDGKAISDIQEIAKALEMYYARNDSYPSDIYGASFSNSTYFQSGRVPKTLNIAEGQPLPYKYDPTRRCICTEELQSDFLAGNCLNPDCDFEEGDPKSYNLEEFQENPELNSYYCISLAQ
jgi:prepilin-type N-terminal cleavage/methylation domain-containing protein